VSEAEPNPNDRAERIVAWLRLAAIGLIVAAERLPHPNPHRDEFDVAAVLVTLYAIGVLVRVHMRPVSRRLTLVVTGVDVAAITLLAFLSGGAYSDARLAYFVIPMTVAFRFGPSATAAVGLGVVAAYAAQAATHPSRSAPDAWGFIAVQAGYLVWMGAAAVAFSILLTQRTSRLVELAVSRRRLLADVMTSEDRERRRLAESLHDHAIQNVLAARQDVDEAAASGPRVELDRAHATLTDLLSELRSAIFELHPHVLDQAGLEAALRAVGQRASRQGGFDLELDLTYRQRHPHEMLLLGAAREFLSNAARHAHASKVTLRLAEENGSIVLVTKDDGAGFDPADDRHVAEAHIGLLSQRERLEAIGGDLAIDSAPGAGTTVTARLPR
jgi:two-component system NarL family sensor kinase